LGQGRREKEENLDGVLRSGAGVSAGAVYWLICDGTGPPGALVLDLAGLGRTLPVFSFPEEAEMFLRLDGLDGDWEVREGVADDFFPHFFGARAGVESVVLDPLPGAMGDGAEGPVGIGPGRFVDRFLGASAPDAVGG
jgi:hypothetical protein